MKRWIITILALLLFSFQASAADLEVLKPVVDVIDGSVRININIKNYNKYDNISLKVVKPNGLIETVDSAIVSDEIEFSFKINENEYSSGGEYLVYIASSDGSMAEQSFFYAFAKEREEAVKRLFEKDADIEQLLRDDDYVKILGVPDGLMDNLDKKGIAKQLKLMLDKGSIEDNISSVIMAIRTACIYECCNQSKSYMLFDEKGAWKYDDVFSLSNVDKDGISVYKYYCDMNQSEKNEVQRLLNNTNISGTEEMYHEFACAVIVSSVNKNTTGWGFLRKMLKSNGVYTGLNLAEYNELSDSQKDKADAYILKNKSAVNSVESLDKIITDAVKYASDSTRNVISASMGGSGGNGVKLLVNTTISTVDRNEEKQISFIDMSNSQWATQGIEYLVNKGIINGYEDNTFRPGNNIKREEFIKLIVSAYDIDVDYSNPFNDVADNMWYTGYIGGAYKAGIIKGDDKGCFGVGKNITRQDAAVMLYRVSGIEIKDEKKFDDEGNISDYALDAVKTLAGNGIINGRDNNNFMPKELLTRAEAAVLIYRLLQL